LRCLQHVNTLISQADQQLGEQMKQKSFSKNSLKRQLKPLAKLFESN